MTPVITVMNYIYLLRLHVDAFRPIQAEAGLQIVVVSTCLRFTTLAK